MVFPDYFRQPGCNLHIVAALSVPLLVAICLSLRHFIHYKMYSPPLSLLIFRKTQYYHTHLHPLHKALAHILLRLFGRTIRLGSHSCLSFAHVLSRHLSIVIAFKSRRVFARWPHLLPMFGHHAWPPCDIYRQLWLSIF